MSTTQVLIGLAIVPFVIVAVRLTQHACIAFIERMKVRARRRERRRQEALREYIF